MKESGKKFVCEYDGCDKSFNRRDYLERHAVNHLAIKPFYCEQCKRHFSRKDLYDNHMNTRFHAKRLEEIAKANSSDRRSSSQPSREPSLEPASPEYISRRFPGSELYSRQRSETPIFGSSGAACDEPLLPLSVHTGYNDNSQSTFSKDQNLWDQNLSPAAFASGEWTQDLVNIDDMSCMAPNTAEWTGNSLTNIPLAGPLPSQTAVMPPVIGFQGIPSYAELTPPSTSGNDYGQAYRRSSSHASEPSLVADEWNKDLVESAITQPETPGDYFDLTNGPLTDPMTLCIDVTVDPRHKQFRAFSDELT